MPSYKLSYFNGKGRAEAVRMAFAVGGVKYEDVRVERQDWPALKPKMPQGAMPVLEVDGKLLPQSMAILRYVGRELDLYGNTSWEKAEIDCILDTLGDVTASRSRFMKEQNLDQKKKLILAHTETNVPKVLDYIEKTLADNSGGHGFIVGSALSIADLALYSAMDYPQEVFGISLDKYHKVLEHRKMVEAIPSIADYFETRQKEDNLVTLFFAPEVAKCRT